MENIKHLSTWKTQVHLEAAAPLTSLFYICFAGCLWQVPSDGGIRSHPLPLLTDCWAGKPTLQWGRMHKRVTRARYHFGSRPIVFKQKQKDILAVKKCDFSFSPLHTVSLLKESTMLQCHSETTNFLGSLIHQRKFLQRSEKNNFPFQLSFLQLTPYLTV